MTEPQNGSSTAAGPQRDASGARHEHRRALRWSLAAVTFVVGLLVGGVLVGIVAVRSTQVPAASGDPAMASSPASSPAAASSPSAAASAEVQVNQACLRSINAAQDVYQQLGDLGDAARNLDAARLDEVIQNLQPLQQRLRDNLPACQVTTRLPDGSAITGAPEDSAAPSGASPTPSR